MKGNLRLICLCLVLAFFGTILERIAPRQNAVGAEVVPNGNNLTTNTSSPIATALSQKDSVTNASWLQPTALITAFIAGSISLYTLKRQRELGYEASAQTLIHHQYDLCRNLDQARLDHPELSHMLVLPSEAEEVWANYDESKKRVRSIIHEQGTQTEAEQNRMYLREHALALHVFNIYEETLHQRNLAKETRRLGLLNMLVEYYERRMLRNPRLRYHWEHGGLEMMEPATRERYNAQVKSAFPDDPVDSKSPIED